jgi:UDP-N-acetylglucosamine 4,6-dehydratase
VARRFRVEWTRILGAALAVDFRLEDWMILREIDVGCLEGSILLTGGSGTLGRATVLYAAREKREVSFTAFARSESRLAQLKRVFPRTRTIIGDVRDSRSVLSAVAGHDLVIHMAAMKRIPECEEQPQECIMTNVIGTQNVLNACIAHDVPCVIISTDKACRAATTYGASKLLTESFLLSAAREAPYTKFVGVRYGNVIASTGSVVQLWLEQVEAGAKLTLTARGMTRFWMSPFDAVELIEESLNIGSGSIIVPKMSSLMLEDMAEMLHPGCELEVTGLRSNEKMHEDLVHPWEPVDDQKNHFVIRVGTDFPTGFVYTSMAAPRLSRSELMRMLSDAQEIESCK